MSFNSIHFLVFLPVVTFIYFLLSPKIKNVWLLISSYYFYMCWNAQYALLIMISTIITYGSGIIIGKINRSDNNMQKKKLYKKIIVVFCLVINLGILFCFKYYNFVTDIILKIFYRMNIKLSIPTLDVLLPVGISFYTFQALSYTIDIYREEIYEEKNFVKYALFVSFFPQLVAGPIERSKNLLKQLAQPRKFSFENAREGLLLMLWGFFMKMVIADRVAVFVDTVYSDYSAYTGFFLIVATILFAVQIYCDFAGYSTIAMGTARILGISLMDNFNAPYLSFSVGEFWSKWHISLTSWFKDYFYISLGGNRKGKVRKHLNKLIVFLVSGLWHGAEFSYVAWGGINGLYLIIGEETKPFRDKLIRLFGIHREKISYKLFRMLITFSLICLSWVFFRARSFSEAIDIIRNMFVCNNIWVLFDGSLYRCGLDVQNFQLAIISIFILIFADYCKHRGIVIRNIIASQDWWFRCLFIVAVICVVLLFGKWGPAFNKTSFIYFQF